MKVVWLIQNLVPYHHARFEAFAAAFDGEAHLVQVTERDAFNVLEFAAAERSYTLHTLFAGAERAAISRPALRSALAAQLANIDPDCVCVSGWGMEIGWLMQDWALRHQRPIVMFSESTAYDEPRTAWKEWIKSRLVASCAAALVGGTPHRDYICRLGLNPATVFLGHNVVDNSYFSRAASARPASLPDWLACGPFFLSCARFGEKKNLLRLVKAYALYARRDQVPCRLAIAGDGELRGALEEMIARENVQDGITLLGPVGYDALPWLYQHCCAFVHASTTEQWGLVVNEAMASGAPVLVSNRCGCAPDLVQEGQNGFLFDPFNEAALATGLWRLSQLDETERRAMGSASRERIAEWGPDRFARSLDAAARRAVESGPPRSMSSGRLVRLLLNWGTPCV